MRVSRDALLRLEPYDAKVSRTVLRGACGLVTVLWAGNGPRLPDSNAVAKVFPRVPDFVCHYHFLADAGKDLFGKQNDTIRARLRKHGIQGKLHKRVGEFKKVIDENPGLADTMVDNLKHRNLQDRMLDLMPAVAAYTLALWVLLGKKQGHGYGFPFDRPLLVFYQKGTDQIHVKMHAKRGGYQRISSRLIT